MSLQIASNLFISKSAKDMLVMSRIAHKLSLEECNVDDGRVEIDELEDENFECQVVIIVRLSSVHF